MSGYTEDYRERKHALFLEQWAPRSKPLPPLTEANLRYNIARANKAEDELRRVKAALRTLKEAFTW